MNDGIVCSCYDLAQLLEVSKGLMARIGQASLLIKSRRMPVEVVGDILLILGHKGFYKRAQLLGCALKCFNDFERDVSLLNQILPFVWEARTWDKSDIAIVVELWLDELYKKRPLNGGMMDALDYDRTINGSIFNFLIYNNPSGNKDLLNFGIDKLVADDMVGILGSFLKARIEGGEGWNLKFEIEQLKNMVSSLSSENNDVIILFVARRIWALCHFERREGRFLSCLEEADKIIFECNSLVRQGVETIRMHLNGFISRFENEIFR